MKDIDCTASFRLTLYTHIHINQMEIERITLHEPSEQLLTGNLESKRDSALSVQKHYSKIHGYWILVI